MDGKKAVAEGWSSGEIMLDRIDAETLEHPDATNTGLRTGRLVGIDVDLIDPAHAEAIRLLIECELSVTPLVRVGRKGMMLCYRTAEPIRKVTVACRDKARTKVEILGQGQQFVAYGVHPDTGEPYRWIGEAQPDTCRFDALPEITPDQLRRLAEGIAAQLGELGYPGVKITGDIGRAEPTAPAAPSHDLPPLPPSEIRDRLACCEAGCSRDEWRDLAAALHATPCADPDFDKRALFAEWSAGGANFVSAEDCEAMYDAMEPKEGGLGSGSFIRLTNAAGYRGPTVGHDGRTPAEVFGPTVTALGLDRPDASPSRERHDARRILLRDEAAQDHRPPPAWLIENFLPDRGTVGLHAPFGSYKSFAATDAALSVASGLPAFGRLPVRRQGPVVYMMGEGIAGFETLRRPAWRQARGIDQSTRLPIYTVEGVPLVRSDDDVQAYFAALGDLHQPPAMVLIDTLARSLTGLNENDAGDAGRYLEMVERMAQQCGCCVLTVMHEGKDHERGARGSSAFAGGFDAVWEMTADQVTLTARVIPVKLKDDAGPEPIHLQGRPIPLPSGKSSLVFDMVEAEDYRRASGKKTGVTASDVYAVLNRLGVVEGKAPPIPTAILAREIAGPDHDDEDDPDVKAILKDLQRKAKGQLAGYVTHLGKGGRGDPTTWALPPRKSSVNGRI